MKIYLAGGLFNAAERLHNLMLESHLVRHGWEIILPQREALKYQDEDGKFDLLQIAAHCMQQVQDSLNVCVCCADGADADSGTSIEYALAIAATGRAIVYRTDFRTDSEKEIGLNAMFRLPGTRYIYDPCFINEFGHGIDAYYSQLAKRIMHEMRLFR